MVTQVIIRKPRELGYIVRELRVSRRITQADLAARAGVSRKWIIDLESGKRTSDLTLVLRALNAMGLELEVTDRAKRKRSHSIDIDAIVDDAKKARP